MNWFIFRPHGRLSNKQPLTWSEMVRNLNRPKAPLFHRRAKNFKDKFKFNIKIKMF